MTDDAQRETTARWLCSAAAAAPLCGWLGRLAASAPDGPRPKFTEHPDSETEAREVAREIRTRA